MTPPEMEPLLIDSAYVEGADYSEWRLFPTAGLGSSFETVVVKHGFQSRDFQTRQGGAISVIDPEILGKLRQEASAISKNMKRLKMTFWVVWLFMGVYAVGRVPEDAVISFVALFVGWLIVFFAAVTRLAKNTDSKLTALVMSYQPIFLKEYGVEIGYDRISLSPKVDFIKAPGIYLRRPRRLVDEEEPVGDKSKDLDAGFPPIYLVHLIPGEIHIREKKHDATSMKVDAETWSLLQSTHQTMIQWQWHPILKVLAIPFLLGFYASCLWVGLHCGSFTFLILLAVLDIVGKVYEYVVDNRNLKAYEEVTTLVNEALQKNETTAHVAVEFHTSEVPGREGKHSRRYQFVQVDSAPTKELM